MWEGYFPQPEGFKQMIFDSLGRIGDAVPATIELGYHLCYGSPRDEHLVQPKDMANVVEMANGICAAVHRPISYIHMPVPKDRSDDAFFVPLERLDLPDGTELYLGLIHDGDDTGNRARLAAARKYAEIDGIGSECGWGRAGETRLEPIVEAHRQAIMAASGDAS